MRLDLSNYLIHFTKGVDINDNEAAYNNLKKILVSQCIIANNGDVRGKYKCVCFTEAPIECIKKEKGIECYRGDKKYSNFGIMIPKIEIYMQGGRPALYLDGSDFKHLPDHLKHRFVVFEPLKKIAKTDIPKDFTWEREWRKEGDICLKDVGEYQIIVPSATIGAQLKNDAENESFNLFDECNNLKVPIIPFTKLGGEIFQDKCPEPIKVQDDSILCIDGSC